MQEQPKKQAIPSGWAYSTLGEIASYINGRAFKPDEWQSFGKPIIRIQNLNNPDAKVNYSSVMHEDRYKVNQGDILYAWSASLGAHTWRGGEAWLNQHIFRVVPYSCCNKSFIFYLLHKFTQDLYKKSHGSGMVHVTKGKFEETEVILPPFNEQIRIAGALDELFSGLDAAVAELKRIKTNIKRYRASVLQAAVEGRLTAEWRKQNPPSETGAELLARLLKERRAKWEENQLKKYAEQGKTPPKDWKEKYPEPVKPDTTGLPELPEGWVWASLHQLSWNSSYGTSDKCSYDATGLAVIRIPNIKNGSLCLKNVKYASGSLDIPANDLIAPGDALIIRTNGSKSLIGKIALITNKPTHPLYYASYLIRFRVVNISQLPSWLGKIWDVSLIRNWIEDRAATSAGQHNVSMSTLNALPIPIPTIKEQTQAITVIDSRLKIADALDETLDNALKRAAILRQSILKRAFEGRLVPQDPNDEPASVLLERIRAERAEQSATVNPTRTKRKGKGDAN